MHNERLFMSFQPVSSITAHIRPMADTRKLGEVFDESVQSRILEGMRPDLLIPKFYAESLSGLRRDRPDPLDHCPQRTFEQDLVGPFIVAMFAPTDQSGTASPWKLQPGAHKSSQPS